jgi:CRP-like cAMP-binding protein
MGMGQSPDAPACGAFYTAGQSPQITVPVQSPQEHAAPDLPEGWPSRALNRDFTAALLAHLGHGQARSGRAGQIVQRGDAPPDALPLVDSGVLEVVMLLDAEGRRVVPVWFGAGEMAMLSTLYGDTAPRGDLVWRRPGQLRWFERRTVEQVVQAHPPLMAALARFLAQRLREVQQRERLWLERGVHERVRSVLARLAAGERRLLRLTHEELADHCGVSRPKLSAALKVLERAGALRLHRGGIEILRPEAFQ